MDKFITQNNLKQLVGDAMSVYVASAYLSRSAIDDLNATLNELPNKGGRIFRFLLDEDFFPDQALRPALINMLLEIPNSEVRIYTGHRLFHPKLYLFENGNRMCATIGSFNMTGGGAGKNVEAGVEVRDPKFHRKAKEFFEEFWDHENTIVATRDPSAVFVERRFQPGDAVNVVATGDKGVILSGKPELISDSREWLYPVQVEAKGSQKLRESELSPVRVAHHRTESQYEKASGNITEWLKNYVLEKEGDHADDLLASLATTRTELFHYQFRPLFKILNAVSPRLLIADEVGLGKTIEAGIILKELALREDLKRVLVVVPNSLRTKWQDELQIRFDEYYDILQGSDLTSFLDDYTTAPDSARINGIISYDQLCSRTVRQKIGALPDLPSFDLIIIDEAHWLKNESTVRHQLLKELTRKTNALVMMTATPIQLGTDDLFHLVSILVPELCVNMDATSFNASLTVNERINRAIFALRKRDFTTLKDLVTELREKRTFHRRLKDLEGYEEILSRCEAFGDTATEAEIAQLADDLYSLNVLGHYVNRTLRRDVSQKFPKRDVQTREYHYTPEETAFYEAVTEACRERFAAEKKSAFAAITPERRAASSLRALAQAVQDGHVDAAEYLGGIDSEEDEYAHVSGVVASVSPVIEKLGFPTTDSKLTALLDCIDPILTARSDGSEPKLLIFCLFRATIAYLCRELAKLYPHTKVSSITGDDDLALRDAKRREFRDASTPSIMVCSEVAGEGLDFQFCRHLVNYDMPWNPSKLEQRAGRIDRMGQESDVVTIVNLVNARTIEDRIMARLFARVKVFNDTLGPLGDILSKCEKDLTEHMLARSRSEREQRAYEEKLLANAENMIREQERFEEQQVELFGVTDFFYDNALKERRRFSKNEIQLIWETYLNQSARLIESDGEVHRVPVDGDTLPLLVAAIEQGCRDRTSARKSKHYRDLTLSLSQNCRPLDFTYASRTALDNLSLQFLNMGHPFIQGAVRSLRKSYKRNEDALACCANFPDLPAGRYVLFLYRFRVAEHSTSSTRYVEDKIYAVGPEGKVVWLENDELIGNLAFTATPAEPTEEMKRIVGAVTQDHATRVEEKAKTILKESEQRLRCATNRRIMAARRQHEKKVAAINHSLSYTHDPTMRQRRKEEIAAAEEQLESTVASLKTSDLRVVARCSGVVYFINKET